MCASNKTAGQNMLLQIAHFAAMSDCPPTVMVISINSLSPLSVTTPALLEPFA
jgi:hypothetical protein